MALRSGSAPAVGHTFGTRRRPSSPLFQQAAEVVALSSRFQQHNGVVPEVEGKSRRASPYAGASMVEYGELRDDLGLRHAEEWSRPASMFSHRWRLVPYRRRRLWRRRRL